MFLFLCNIGQKILHAILAIWSKKYASAHNTKTMCRHTHTHKIVSLFSRKRFGPFFRFWFIHDFFFLVSCFSLFLCFSIKMYAEMSFFSWYQPSRPLKHMCYPKIKGFQKNRIQFMHENMRDVFSKMGRNRMEKLKP